MEFNASCYQPVKFVPVVLSSQKDFTTREKYAGLFENFSTKWSGVYTASLSAWFCAFVNRKPGGC